MNILVANPGHSPSVRQGVKALHEQELLDVFATTYVDHPDDPLSSTIKRAVRSVYPSYVRQLERRAFHDLPFRKIRTYPWWEVLRTAADKFVGNPTLTDRIWEWSEHRFDQWVARQLHDGIEAVHVNEHAALATIQSARRQGILTFYRQPSQHHAFFTEVYREQTQQYPEIEGDRGHLHDSPLSAKRNARRDRELELADYVLVKSSLTKRTLTDANVDPEKILVTPYGCPEVSPKPQIEPDRVTFLNAGTQNLRKGLHLLYRAWERLAPPPDTAALQLIGAMTLPESLRQGLPGAVHIEDSIPHDELMRRYREATFAFLVSLMLGALRLPAREVARHVATPGQGIDVAAPGRCTPADTHEQGDQREAEPPALLERSKKGFGRAACVSEGRECVPAGHGRSLTAGRQKSVDPSHPRRRDGTLIAEAKETV